MNRIPRVTILIANYNYAKYLEKAIESALKQDYVEIKLAIVDDCSTDNSWEIIYKKFFKTNPHHVLTTDNAAYQKKEVTINRFAGIKCTIIGYKLKNQNGPSMARNFAILDNVKSTDYFAILDADDEYYPYKVRELVNVAIQSPAIGVVYGDYDILDVETGTLTREYKKPFSVAELLKECIVHSGSLISSQALINTIEGKNFYDPQLRCAEDYDLWLRICEKFMICHVPKSLSLVRNHNNNSTNTVRKEIWEQCWNIVAQKFQKRHAIDN